MRIFWQSFVDPVTGADYLRRLTEYLNGIAAPGTEVVVEGMTPPDRDFGRLAEFRCAMQAIDRALRLEDGYDAYVMGHFQDPGLYEIRSALDIPVVGTGEATMLQASTLGRRLGVITLAPEFEIWHREQADLYGLGTRLVAVTSLESNPQEFNASFAGDETVKASLLARIQAAGEKLVAQGADVIVAGGVLPGLFVADFPGLTVGTAPVVNCASVALKSAEMWAQLKKLDGVGPSRGACFAQPKGQAQQDFLALMPATTK
ncbi:aspartate/glutamate racemase family protein [Chachezhania sediminis]|uniref:aspartate/glutamate racemase family protein n=1 Tax=Chachezhania sediminis TaxID=2599291 RepID=UPI00131D6C41|nr:aspartate/glutamate racemase family protein [Chachezhania sediminis]